MLQRFQSPDLTASTSPTVPAVSAGNALPHGRVLGAVTVSVVSHGQGHWVRPLLEQIDSWCGAHVTRAIVTQNLAVSDTQDLAPRRFPIHHRQNPVPLGFGANHNAAFRQCDTEWFLVINPDVLIDSDVLGALTQCEDPSVGLIAPSVWEPGSGHATQERGVITPWEVFAGRILGRNAPKDVLWFPGMFMLFRSEAFASVGGFDERFHMYCEDYDICARLRRTNWKLLRKSETHVTHLAQRDSHIHIQYLFWHLKSLARLWLSTAFWRDWLTVFRQR